MSRPVYITTPIYYVNDRPHIGHAYTTMISDVVARGCRLQGRTVFFLTGTDEHGAKVEKSATARGVTPQALADVNAAEFQRVLRLFDISNDDFIRTTQPRHTRQVQAMIKALQARGAITLGTFSGWYDEGQEEYYTETRAKELDYKSPISGKSLIRASEENYYFRLSEFQGRLEEFFNANPDFIQPSGRFNEVRGRLREGLQDVPVTRTNFSWGIPFPDDKRHVIYVWIDALMNYASALGLAWPLARDLGVPSIEGCAGSTASGAGLESDDATLAQLYESRAHFWPAHTHVIGKEILWFHAVIWPAMLMALELPLPKRIHAHSFWIADGQKMSKSMGNFVDLETIDRFVAHYGLDAWRWYMATQGPLQAADADFRASHFHETYTADLVNLVGNCASRVGAMIAKYCGGTLPDDAERGGEWPIRCEKAIVQWREAMDAFDLNAAARAPLELLREIDAFIHHTEPFKLAKDPANLARVESILSQSARTIRVAGVLLAPFLPTKMDELATAFGGSALGPVHAAGSHCNEFDSVVSFHLPKVGVSIAKLALFPRIDIVASA
ncbi:MAG: methionine--tRNA ligase [Planctomycetota bacterium]|nr:methionine--tRNA ligase [Planctomycetota bacterium]